MKEKECTGCHCVKSLLEFYKDSSRRDGYRSRCKDCISFYNASWYNRNSERAIQNNINNRIINGRGRQSEYARLAAAERAGRWRARDMGVQFEKVNLQSIIEIYGMICNICLGSINNMFELEFDHVVPISLGGTHTANNIKPAHGRCNWRKKRGYGNIKVSDIIAALTS